MQHPVLLGVGVALTAIGWFAFSRDHGLHSSLPTTPPTAAVADGHYVLVVEGDRRQLAITHANRKLEPWAGIAKGFTSDWVLSIRDAQGDSLAEVPLDLSQFAVEAADLGRPVHVEGCVVRDSRIGMLVSAPRFAAAASYTFSRREGERAVTLGQCAAETVLTLAGENR